MSGRLDLTGGAEFNFSRVALTARARLSLGRTTDSPPPMFQAIVHARCLRPGARLCVSDLEQTAIPLAAGDRLALRYGACCPDLGSGAIAAIEADTAILVAADDRWRICRCPERSGIDLPGLVAENWIVIGRDG